MATTELEAAAGTAGSKTAEVREAVTSAGQDLLDRLGVVSGQLRDQAAQAREAAVDLKGTVDERVEELEPARRAQLGFWHAVRVLLRALFVLPRLAVRILGVVADTVDEVADRAPAVASRAASTAKAVTPPVPSRRRDRIRAGLRTSAVVGASFSAGALLGWFLARRRQADLVYEAPTALPAPAPSPATSTATAPATDGNGWRTGDVAVAEAEADQDAAADAGDPARHDEPPAGGTA